MIIGIFTDTYPPDVNGVASASQTLKEVLEAHGHEVIVVTTGLKGQKRLSFQDHIMRIPGFSLRFLYDYRMAFFFNQEAYRELRKIPFDIIHVQQEFGISMFGRICANAFEVPLVYTYHTSYEDYSDYFSHGRKIQDRIAKNAIKNIVRKIVSMKGEIVTPSQKSRLMLKDYGLNRYINVVPNAIDLGIFYQKQDPEQEKAFRKEHGIGERKILLYLGRVATEKNISEVVEGYEKYRDRYPEEDPILLLVGGGPLEKKLHERVLSSPYASSILFLGSVPHEKTPFYYSIADGFLCASTSETQGLTYSEAIASGTIVLAKYDFNLEGFIQDGVTGFFFDDEEAFVEKIHRVITLSPEEKDRIRKAADERNRSLFSSESYYERILHVYEKAKRSTF
jgi:1,2-diacylglycerol 3-alpha-glucosyltransferase